MPARVSMKNRRHRRWIVAVVTCAALVTFYSSRRIDAQYGVKQNGEWPSHGGDLGNTKYSPLDQITAQNFSQLTLAWRWKSADRFLSKTVPGGGELWANSKVI